MKKRPARFVGIDVNWLQVLGTTETPHIDQGVRHQFHPVVALLDVLETEPQPFDFVRPRKRPFDALPSRLHHGVDPPLAPALGTFAMTRSLRDVRTHPRLEDRLAIRL